MKSKKIIVLSLFVTSVLFTGCEKEEKKEPSAARLVSRIDYYQNSSIKLKSMNDTDEVSSTMPDYTIEYQYDEQKRVTEVIITDISGSLTITITYPAKNTMVETIPEPSAMKITYMLNSDGYVISWSDIFRLKGTFIYDNGYLQQTEYYGNFYMPDEVFEEYKKEFGLPDFYEQIASSGTITQIYFWKNGNIETVAQETTFGSYWKSPQDIMTYEYGSAKYIPCDIDFGYLSHYFTAYAPQWYGKTMRNMPLQYKLKRANGFEYIVAYRYETDSDDYPVKIFVQEGNNSEALRAVIEYRDTIK